MSGTEKASGRIEDLAADLLGVDDFRALCESVLERCILPQQRFEADEFGRDEHSSASAGAVLNGVGSLPTIGPATRQALVAAIHDLIRPDGTLRGHDRQMNVGTTSWSLAQVLLGLSRFGGEDVRASTRFGAAVDRLLNCQDGEDGAWLLREGDLKDPLFAFYPSLLFVDLCRTPDWRNLAERVLARTRSYLATALLGNVTLVDKVLAAHVIDQVEKVLPAGEPDRRAFERRRTSLLNSLVGDSGLRIEDRIVQNNVQPRWHSVTWTGALYPCTRRWGSVTAPYNVMIGDRVIREFDAEAGAWHGVGSSRGLGRSWATSLGLLSTYLLASDLRAADLNAEDWHRLVDEVGNGRKFDVVISFGGPDRAIAEAIRNRLVAAGLSVFYDDDFQHQLLGEDLAVVLQDIYFARSRYAITILSRAFVKSEWAGNWEWRAVLARMNRQREGYLLPYFLEKIDIPGLNPTIGHLSAEKFTALEFADVVIRKIRGH
ncbi:TIR domain-containing protein [Amycolatopsis alba]|uniref:TIR domain-containing protein n=1 Tax=Amycolatopsis alba DSM 44262 TaxID=1125972 RepID=A0A229RSM9_AMYAL|nr:TIR domain-containing protein [Amycolatopsis alba]OXM49668.1 TIR domain-containing protein [Amycolatopsis alba DSM 44262]